MKRLTTFIFLILFAFSGFGQTITTYQGSSNIVTDGGFDDACGVNWTCNAGWTIIGGKAVGTATTTDLTQSNILTIGKTYKVIYTVNDFVSGQVRCKVGTTVGSISASNGTFENILVCSGNGHLDIDGVEAFTGKVDNVSVQEWYPDGRVITYDGKVIRQD